MSPDHSTPVPIDAPDIVYTEEDDKVIDDFLKASGESVLHPRSSCMHAS